MSATILIVDDEPAARYALRRAFDGEFVLLEAASVAEAREQLRAGRPDVVLLDYRMPGEDGVVLLHELAGAESPAVIMVTGQGSERLAVEAIKAGAYDYLSKPYDLDELRSVVDRAVERQSLRREVAGLRGRLAGDGDFGAMSGSSRVMRDLFQLADRVAASDLSVLVLGESGTGKDVLANEIHRRSHRAARPFVAINCAALPENLVESELFGYEKGAFTGATAARAGKFEQAHRGTLFLDEIGDMTLATQAKILRAAESGAVERVGGAKTTNVDVRLLSATNKNLNEAIRAGLFREDLYFRLGAVTLEIPPLRERREDIPGLALQFWNDFARKYSRASGEMSRPALTRLMEHSWPGNVRELRNTIEKIFVLNGDDVITSAHVEMHLRKDAAPAASAFDTALAANDYRDARRLFETEYIERKLREFNGNVTRTAAAIGLERQSLQEKMKKLGILRADLAGN